MTPDIIPVIRVDFQNSDRMGNVRLNTKGAVEDLARQNVQLKSGLILRLVDAELSARGRVEFNDQEAGWVASVDWKEVIGSGPD